MRWSPFQERAWVTGMWREEYWICTTLEGERARSAFSSRLIHPHRCHSDHQRHHLDSFHLPRPSIRSHSRSLEQLTSSRCLPLFSSVAVTPLLRVYEGRHSAAARCAISAAESAHEVPSEQRRSRCSRLFLLSDHRGQIRVGRLDLDSGFSGFLYPQWDGRRRDCRDYRPWSDRLDRSECARSESVTREPVCGVSIECDASVKCGTSAPLCENMMAGAAGTPGVQRRPDQA